MTDARANQLVSAATTVANLKDTTIVVPATESQARPLTSIKDPEKQREVWKEAVETAPDGKVTAAHVAEVVERRREREAVGA